jgi:serine/threonine-protein kinase HipA
MPRHRRHPPLRVHLDNLLVGHLAKDTSGAVSFRYAEAWLEWEHAFPVSLSLPLREDAYRGERVVAVFENLLPDSEPLRRRVAGKVGARGTDAYSLLSAIGRDCVGALRFAADGEDLGEGGAAGETAIKGDAIDEDGIERLLANLAQAPLGLGPEEDFRISVAGAQEKTALLWHGGRWLKPRGTTPTSHIFKTQIGRLSNGIDLSNSVENEYYCLRLVAVFGLPVAQAEIMTFGKTKALVIERFDRRWTTGGRLLRLPQEDCCQALSIPPTQKYQTEGGPGMVHILDLLKGSDTPAEDQRVFLKAQILFWLIGATDGHAKNFSIHLGPGGSFRLAPLYDVLTAQPSLDASQIDRRQLRLAMSVGTNRHYRVGDIHGRHFVQTGAEAGLPKAIVRAAIEEIADSAEKAMDRLEGALPAGFPEGMHASVRGAMAARLRNLRPSETA